MKQFELYLTVRDTDSFRIEESASIITNDIIELCSKIPLLIADIMRKMHDEETYELRMKDDDIPF